MIAKMNKYLFVVYHKEYEDFLRKLRTLGVVHIKETKNKKKIASLEEKLAERREVDLLYRRVRARRSKDAPEEVRVVPADRHEMASSRKAVEDMFEWEQNLSNQVASAERELAYWQIWGEIDLSHLEKLRQSGNPIRFYVVPTTAYKESWEEEFGAVVINSFRAHNYFITIGNYDRRLDAEEVKAPTKTLQELEERVETFRKELAKTQANIENYANTRIGELSGSIHFIDKEYAFSNALLQASDEAENQVKVLEGWVPEDKVFDFEKALEDLPIYVENVPIQSDDNIPIKLKNNAYVRLFEPITKMYSLPNYGELDLTAALAPFFMLFFALCFGDGGYGLLLLVGATIAKFKSKNQGVRDICSMLQWLGGTTAVVGSLMGTVFGMVMPWASNGGVLGSVRDDYFLNQNNLMILSIALGFIQIIFGKFVAGIKKTHQRGFKYGLSTFAWSFFILTAILGVLSQSAFPDKTWISFAMYGIAGLCLLIALFYNSPDKNIFVNFSSGLWDTYNTATGLLGDVLSYIRLFAIGLTGGILGGVFNTLAYNISEGLPIGINFLVMTIILLFGHGLNFGLCMISSLVHPIRLTFVEFYKNADFEGGGKQYTPLD